MPCRYTGAHDRSPRLLREHQARHRRTTLFRVRVFALCGSADKTYALSRVAFEQGWALGGAWYSKGTES